MVNVAGLLGGGEVDFSLLLSGHFKFALFPGVSVKVSA